MKNTKIAFYDFNNLSNYFKSNVEDLTIKPKESFWKVAKVDDNKNIVIRKTKDMVAE